MQVEESQETDHRTKESSQSRYLIYEIDDILKSKGLSHDVSGIILRFLPETYPTYVNYSSFTYQDLPGVSVKGPEVDKKLYPLFKEGLPIGVPSTKRIEVVAEMRNAAKDARDGKTPGNNDSLVAKALEKRTANMVIIYHRYNYSDDEYDGNYYHYNNSRRYVGFEMLQEDDEGNYIDTVMTYIVLGDITSQVEKGVQFCIDNGLCKYLPVLHYRSSIQIR